MLPPVAPPVADAEAELELLAWPKMLPVPVWAGTAEPELCEKIPPPDGWPNEKMELLDDWATLDAWPSSLPELGAPGAVPLCGVGEPPNEKMELPDDCVGAWPPAPDSGADSPKAKMEAPDEVAGVAALGPPNLNMEDPAAPAPLEELLASAAALPDELAAPKIGVALASEVAPKMEPLLPAEAEAPKIEPPAVPKMLLPLLVLLSKIDPVVLPAAGGVSKMLAGALPEPLLPLLVAVVDAKMDPSPKREPPVLLEAGSALNTDLTSPPVAAATPNKLPTVFPDEDAPENKLDAPVEESKRDPPPVEESKMDPPLFLSRMEPPLPAELLPKRNPALLLLLMALLFEPVFEPEVAAAFPSPASYALSLKHSPSSSPPSAASLSGWVAQSTLGSNS